MKDQMDPAMPNARLNMSAPIEPGNPSLLTQHTSRPYMDKSRMHLAPPSGDPGRDKVNYRMVWGLDLKEFSCGLGAASINVVLTFPLNKLMFRQQLYGITTREAMRQLYSDGKFHLYRGMLPPLIHKTACLSVMFGMYDGYKKVLLVYCPHMPAVMNKGTAAVMAGCTEAILLPLERIQTLLQDRHYHKQYKNTLHAFRQLWGYGIGEYYRGLTPVLMRNGASNALFFLLRGEVKDLFPKAKTPGGDIVHNFVSGSVLGAGISTLFYPLNVVKTQMQSQVGGEFLSCRRAFWIVFNERNRSLQGMFRGVHVNYIRSMMSWGIINASYELLRSVLFPDHPDSCDGYS